MFTCIKSLNRYNLRHNYCIIFSIFLYFKYIQFSFEFIHLQICTCYNLFAHRKKSYQLLICRVAKNLPVLGLLNHFIKSSTVAYKRVAYKKILVQLAIEIEKIEIEIEIEIIYFQIKSQRVYNQNISIYNTSKYIKVYTIYSL